MKLKEFREYVLSQSPFWRGLSQGAAKILLEDIDREIERNFREGEEAGYLQGKAVGPQLDPEVCRRIEALERCVTGHLGRIDGLSKKLEESVDLIYELKRWAKRIDECRVKGWEIFGRPF